MQEYFAQRMARLKKDRGQDVSSTAPQDASPVCSSNKEPRKKKRSEKAAGAPEETESSSTPIVTEEDAKQEPDRPRKKKKKRKMAENESCISTAGLGHTCEEPPPKKKKKKKKKSKKHNTDSQQVNGPDKQQTVTSEVEKEPEEVDDEIREGAEMKKRKSKKIQSAQSLNPQPFYSPL